MNLRRVTLTGIILLLGLTLNYSTGRASIAELIEETSPSPAEKQFQEALREYDRGNMSRAYREFKRVTEKFPDHRRSRDSQYYLKLLEPQVELGQSIPRIQVKLLETSRLRLDQPTPVEIKTPRGEKRTVRAGEDVIIRVDSGKLITDGWFKSSPDRFTVRPKQGNFLRFEGNQYRGSLQFMIEDGSLIMVNELPLNEYLYGVVRKETAPGWPIDALRSQAVASRSFALYRMIQFKDRPYDLDATWLSQVYGGKSAETDRVIQAVNDTVGEILVFEGKPIGAFFHANSGGHTERPGTVWSGSSHPYLVAKEDPYSVGANYDTWEQTISIEKIRKKLRQADQPTPSWNPNFRIIRRSVSGRATRLAYTASSGATVHVEANEFRLALDPTVIKSTWFTSIDSHGSSIYFSGKGWGHGVGMSQWGAYTMAESDHSYQEILEFYFPRPKFIENFDKEMLARVR